MSAWRHRPQSFEGLLPQPRRARAIPPRPANWQCEPCVFWVYVLQSVSSGKRYVGQTNDPQGRIRQHNQPQTNRSVYTARDPGPWVLVHSERFPSRVAAMARERFLKSGQGRDWLKRMLGVRLAVGGASPPQAD